MELRRCSVNNHRLRTMNKLRIWQVSNPKQWQELTAVLADVGSRFVGPIGSAHVPARCSVFRGPGHPRSNASHPMRHHCLLAPLRQYQADYCQNPLRGVEGLPLGGSMAVRSFFWGRVTGASPRMHICSSLFGRGLPTPGFPPSSKF